MDQGLKGCNKGTGCEYTHVTVCPESLEKKTCGNSQEGKRCKSGYHLKGTKSVKQNSDTPPLNSQDRLESEPGTSQSRKTKSKKKPPPPREPTDDSDDVEEDDEDDSDSGDVVKSFLESVVRLVREVRPVKRKKKKEATSDLLKSLQNLLR